ncbi:MAG: peptidyl-prolyl cis-trans isomerase [Gammaproteobacteria bacterium]|nr:peptidyl-prolyl cis-trans isomerase [Gammaproteobacteria bacterium]MDH5514220.1 peptidyl-prolyl cis-trans isomerase [Gammaproteobacteria bacterium]
MTRITRRVALFITFPLVLTWLGACSDEPSGVAETTDARQAQESRLTGITAGSDPAAGKLHDVVARVGDQSITFREINTMINSAAIVGLSMPELGSPERDTVRLTLLDKLITANLLYLDARQQGVDKEPEYQRAVDQFRDGILAKLYRSRVLIGEIDVAEEDVREFYNNNIVEGTELTGELKAGIEATIRKNRMKGRIANSRERLREGHMAAINVSDLEPADDQVRSEHDVLAELDGVGITWGEVRPALQRAHALKSVQMRIEELEKIIDNRIMAQKAKEAGLENDPVFKARMDEFSKTSLINIHRGRLIDSWEPAGEETRDYYEANKDRIIVKEMRKLQMLVVETEQEAARLKKQIEAGELTFHKAVAEHSIVPDANKTLGQIGWVQEGSGFPELDEVTFLLEAGEIGGPVQSPAGWHVMRVLDQRDALHKNIADPQTLKEARRMLLEDRLNQYVINLRKDNFKVAIEEDMLQKLSQQEIDWYQEIQEKARKSPEEVIEDIKRLQK